MGVHAKRPPTSSWEPRSFYPVENDSLHRHGRARPGHPCLSYLSPARTWMPGSADKCT